MKRAPIVLAGTAIGLAGLISYHTTASGSVGVPGGLTGPPASGAGTQAAAGTSGSGGTSGATGTGSTQNASATTTQSTTSAPVTGTPSSQPTGPAVVRSAVGHDIQYGYGDLSVRVTMLGSKITGISLARAAVADPQSGSIDRYVFPILKREVLQAQSAQIQGISGASYTSQAYAQSLQSAIDQLTTSHS